MRRRIAIAFPWLVLALWAAGILLRDATRWTALLFYLPSVGVATMLLGLAVAEALRRRPRRVVAYAAAALLPLAVVATLENRWTPPPAPRAADASPELVFAHWNVYRGGVGWEPVRARLRATDLDVGVVSEVPAGMTAAALAAELGPGYRASLADSLAGLCRGELAAGPSSTSEELDLLLFDCRLPEGTVRVLAADVLADPLVDRRPLLAEIARWADVHRADLVAGDLNTPRRSRGLRPPPPGTVHCYDAAGAGWSYTWPVPFPMYAIDHCLAGPRVVPVAYALDATLASDHRLQTLRFHLAE